MISKHDSATLLYLIKQLELAVSGRLDSVLGPAGVTSTQYTALTVLERHPGMTAAALARHSFVRAQTAASLVHALERAGWVERHPDPNSRRQNLIYLTDTGQSLLSMLRDPVQAIEERVVDGLSAAQRDDLRSALMASRVSLEEAD